MSAARRTNPLRTEPQQARARHAVDAILGAAGDLLDEGGYDALTTKAVAERAEVNIATLYRYFPDKLSLVRALHQRIEAAVAPALEAAAQGIAQQRDWRAGVTAWVDTLDRLRRSTVGFDGLTRSLTVSATLRPIRDEFDAGVTRSLAEALRARNSSLDARQARTTAATTVAAVNGVLADRNGKKPANPSASIVAIGWLSSVGHLDG